MKCVAEDQCGCYSDMLRYAIGQSVPAKNNCQIWYVYFSLGKRFAIGQYSDNGKLMLDLLTGLITCNCTFRLQM